MAKMSAEQVNRKCPSEAWFYNFQSPIPTTSPPSPHHWHWCHLANTLKHTLNKWTTRISTFGIAIISVLHGYSTQCHFHSLSLSAVASLLVIVL